MKLRQIKKVRFWSLRNGIGSSGGVLFDCDTQVKRLCRVVRVADGLKWQIIKKKYQHEWDYYLEQDQECLDNEFYI